MKINLSKHAKQRLLERGIILKEIIETIEMPDYVISKENKKEAHKKIRDKTLKVVYAEEDNFINIITVIWK